MEMTIDEKIKNLELELTRLKIIREKEIECENLSNKYNGKYFYRTEDNYRGSGKIYYHVVSATKIINNGDLEFIGSKICKVENNLEKSIEYRFKTGEKLEFPITHVVEISKEKYYAVINDYLNYVQNEFKE